MCALTNWYVQFWWLSSRCAVTWSKGENMLTKVVASRPGTVPVFTQEGVGGKKTLRASICKKWPVMWKRNKWLGNLRVAIPERYLHICIVCLWCKAYCLRNTSCRLTHARWIGKAWANKGTSQVLDWNKTLRRKSLVKQSNTKEKAVHLSSR